MQRRKHNKFYVVRHNAYVHGQRLEDNFINNGTLQKWEKHTKPTTPIHPNGTSLEHSSGSSLKFSQRTHLQLLSTSLKLGWLTNEELPSIYKEKWGALLHQPQQNCQHKLGTYLMNLSTNLLLQSWMHAWQQLVKYLCHQPPICQETIVWK